MTTLHPSLAHHDWWRSAVVYQIYPRSFADANNDGTGDIAGMIAHLDHLAGLGVDAVWVSPWYPSPLHDGGYDVADYCDIKPEFGTLAQADEFIARAHELGIRVVIDLVPNHCSIDHPLFQAALAAGPGSPERDLFIFREGRGPDGSQPPTNWGAHFGGPAWHRVTEADGTPGQWYLHLFAPEQPDFNWENPAVTDFFDDVLRFWFDRGVDGFRIDVADSMFKDQTFPDIPLDPKTGLGTLEKYEGSPFWDRPAMADHQRHWRAVADEYADTDLGPRVFVSEAYLPGPRRKHYVAEGRLHTSFNFEFLESAWTAPSLRTVITQSIAEHDEVGAPTTWVLNNHDNYRSPSRFGRHPSGMDFSVTPDEDLEPGQAPHWADAMVAAPLDLDLGLRRARAAALLMLALPGGAYVYQGEELGLEEVEDLPEHLLQDPIWERSGHTERGRDGCRVPIPWSGTHQPFGFGQSAEPWLPQPAHWAGLSVEAQTGRDGSMLELYRSLLAERRANPALGAGSITWDESSADVLSFTRDPGFRCVVNFGAEPVAVEGEPIIASQPLVDGLLPSDAAVWLRTA
ncbi:glycoside hydrolase family 13 protein [Propionibacteriaceae bacterium G1746]|uniref:glycoside hydrolase family 13 protein n=1 Tax=Aestuariimicrobium sp. G57 TaxID=3418485 RepID=UPI003C2A0A2E